MVNSEKKTHNLAALWSLKGWGVKAKWKTKDKLRQFCNSPRKDDVFDHMEAVGREYLDELGINVRGGHGYLLVIENEGKEETST